MSADNPDCYFGDHDWRGGACVACGKRLRCSCGQFLSVDNIDAHTLRCPWIQAHVIEGKPE